MGKKIKKGTKGDAALYITRSTALKKLKLSLKEFRRLCILKGVFPKEPKRKFKGQNKTYFLLKDIRFLAHEKLINKFREINAFQKKINKAKTKTNKYDYKKLKDNKPIYSIQHIIKERYPRFADALNDIDDALSLINLFSILTKHDLHNIKSETVEECRRLNREFMLYLSVSQSVKRGFISIKGIYLNTEIMGVDCTWLVPYAQPQKLPFEVDYEVMLTFLEVYTTLMKFVNLKLYKDIGLEYPPPKEFSDNPFFGYNSFQIKALQEQVKNRPKENDEIVPIDSEEMKKIQKKSEKTEQTKNLFKNYVFYIGREVPREIFELIISSCGGLFADDSDESSYNEDSSEITHYIVDRPYESINFKSNKEYIQPQWIFDCLNSGKILPTADYAPQKSITVVDNSGKKKTELTKLPPHLSPFYEYNPGENTYTPKDIKKSKKAVEVQSEDENEPEETEEKKEKVRNELNEMLLSKNKKKLLQKIRENNQRKYKKVVIPQ